MITVVVPIRNRSINNLRKSLTSLREASSELFEGIVSDFGSSPNISEKYEELCQQLDFRLVRSESQGLPWSRSRAINVGVRQSRGDFIFTSDVDMQYASDPLGYCVHNAKAKTAFNIAPLWMQANRNRRSAIDRGKGHMGIQFVERRAFHELRGYDERILFWGSEDTDWASRLRAIGYSIAWLPEDMKVYHLWHPPEFADLYRPNTSWFDTIHAMLQNKNHPILAQDWGYQLSFSDRPILGAIAQGGIACLAFKEGSLLERWPELNRILQGEKVVHLKLGPRRTKRRLSSLAGPLRAALGWMIEKSGLSIEEQLNDNFDVLYASLPILQREFALVDYFLDSDLSGVWLMCR